MASNSIMHRAEEISCVRKESKDKLYHNYLWLCQMSVKNGSFCDVHNYPNP